MKYLEFGTEHPELMVILHGGGIYYRAADIVHSDVDPLRRVAFLCIGVQRAFNGKLRVDDFLNALTPDHSQPHFERLGLFGRDGLDDAQQLLGIRDIRKAALAIGGFHFQLVTICHQFISVLCASRTVRHTYKSVFRSSLTDLCVALECRKSDFTIYAAQRAPICTI